MDNEAHHLVAVAKFIVIPGVELDKLLFDGDARTSIRAEGAGATVKFHRRHSGHRYKPVYPLGGSLDACFTTFLISSFLSTLSCSS